MADANSLSAADYAELLHFRDQLRRFLHWSAAQAKAVGLTPAQHQLLLAIRGHGHAPTIGDVAEHLMLRHHSAVELVDRAEQAGLVARSDDPDDHRAVRLALSVEGEARLAELSAAHVDELHRLQHPRSVLQIPPDQATSEGQKRRTR
jgi:DNA-binding MarR family transcriptional regulator